MKQSSALIQKLDIFAHIGEVCRYRAVWKYCPLLRGERWHSYRSPFPAIMSRSLPKVPILARCPCYRAADIGKFDCSDICWRDHYTLFHAIFAKTHERVVCIIHESMSTIWRGQSITLGRDSPAKTHEINIWVKDDEAWKIQDHILTRRNSPTANQTRNDRRKYTVSLLETHLSVCLVHLQISFFHICLLSSQWTNWFMVERFRMLILSLSFALSPSTMQSYRLIMHVSSTLISPSSFLCELVFWYLYYASQRLTSMLFYTINLTLLLNFSIDVSFHRLSSHMPCYIQCYFDDV